MNPISKHSRSHLAAATLLLAFGLSAALAQTSSPTSTPRASDAILLTPFEVNSSTDRGYAAQNTLSGTRLSTSVQDIGGTMTIITPEVWEDLALTSTNDLLRFTPGAEKNDVQEADGNGQALFFGDNTRVRGIQFENIVRNGFRTNLPSDTYNSARFEFQRGANAILFGTTGAGGGVAGMVNRTTQDATFHNRGRYQFRVDEFGSLRHALSYNRILIPKKLALYGALLRDDTKSWIEPTFQKQKRAYAALTYRANDQLSFNARYESMNWLRTAAEAGMTYDGVSPVLNAAAAAGTTPSALAIVSASNRLQTNATGLPAYYQNNGYRNQNTTSVVFGSAGAGPTLQNWRGKIVGANVNIAGFSNVSLPAGIVPLDFYPLGEAATQDFDGYNIQGNVRYQPHRKLSFEYAYNYEFMTYEFINANQQRLLIDGSRTLQDGVTPNPNAGRFYVDLGPAFTLFQDRYAKNHRVTATVNHNFREGSRLRWLGKHDVVFMYEQQNQTHFWDQRRLLNTTPLAGYPAALQEATQQNWVRFITYVDPQARTFSGPTNSQGFEAEANKVPGVRAKWLPVAGSGQAFDETTDSLLAVWQGRFWNDRIIATGGIREDSFTRDSGLPTQDPSQPAGVVIPARRITMVRDTAQSALSPRTKNYSLVFHALRNKGFVDYLSPYYNYSDAFSSGVFTKLVDGSAAPNATGESEDYGLKFGLFGGKISGVFSLFDAYNLNNPNERSILFGELSSLFEYLDPVKYANYINVSNVRETKDVRSRGWEFQLTANLTRNWRASFSVDHFKTETSNIAPLTGKLIEQFRSQWLARPNDLIPGGARTVQDVFNTMNFSYLAATAQQGSVTTNERAYRVNGFTNYSITSGALRGLGFGANATWQDKPANGFALQRVGTNFVPDPNRVFWGSTLLRVGAHVSYQRRLWNDRLNWRAQLNVQDIGGVEPYTIRKSATSAAPTTPITTYWHRGSPQTWMVTNTFEF
ncbi:MAG: TonB-dependent receptor plug domain-containing protein [Opitutaceae bacterium]